MFDYQYPSKTNTIALLSYYSLIFRHCNVKTYRLYTYQRNCSNKKKLELIGHLDW